MGKEHPQMTSTGITTIQFHGASLIVQRGDTPDTTYVAMKPVVEGMGVSWQGQHDKLTKHPVLSKGIKEILIPSAGGDQLMTALPLNRLHFWLATLHPNKIPDPAVRDKVIIYQEEAADALFERFFGQAIHNPISQSKLARQMAAIMEDKLEKAISILLPGMIEARLEADDRAVAVGFKPAIEILIEKRVPPRGRRQLSQQCSASLRRFSTDRGYKMRISRETGRYLFHVDAINAWLQLDGNRMIVDHVDAIGRQSNLFLVPRRS